MPSRRFVMPCIESSFGVAKTTPVLGTDRFYLRLSESTAFKAELVPQTDNIGYGGGRATDAEEVADVHLAQGSIATVLYPGIFSNLLLNWAITVINTGRTTPWTTTDAGSVMPEGDLASLSFYHAFQLPSGTYVRERWSGCKCAKWGLKFMETPQGRKLVFTADWIGIKCATNGVESSPEAAPDATAFPAPAETDYPTGPWLFSHIANGTGTCKIGSARTQIIDLAISGDNQLDARTYESKFNSIIRFLGRKVTADVGLRFKPSPDDLASFQARTLQDSEFILDNGTNTLKIDMYAKNRLVGHDRQYDDGAEFGRKVQLKNFWSPADSTDIAFSFT